MRSRRVSPADRSGRIPLIVRCLLLAGLLMAGTPRFGRAEEAPAASADSAHFTVREIAPGVHAVIRREPLGLANHSNAVFIVNEEDVVVVDTQFTRNATQEVLAALRRITDKPVSFVINTHWHDDHSFGNQVYREAFPGVTFISQARTRSDMAGVGAENRKQQVEDGPEALAAVQELVEKGVDMFGKPLSDDERLTYRSSLEIFGQYMREVPDFRLTLPELTFDVRLTLIRGGRTIEIRHFGSAVTPGDAVVYLPAEMIVIAGDLVNAPFPYTYRSSLTGWIAALDSLEALHPDLIVPGHGPVLEGVEHLRTLRGMMSSIRRQTAEAVLRGAPLAEVIKSVRLDEYEAPLTGGRKMLTSLFRGYFAGPAISACFQEITGAK